jgi:hypothetical protein
VFNPRIITFPSEPIDDTEQGTYNHPLEGISTQSSGVTESSLNPQSLTFCPSGSVHINNGNSEQEGSGNETLSEVVTAMASGPSTESARTGWGNEGGATLNFSTSHGYGLEQMMRDAVRQNLL